MQILFGRGQQLNIGFWKTKLIDCQTINKKHTYIRSIWKRATINKKINNKTTSKVVGMINVRIPWKIVNGIINCFPTSLIVRAHDGSKYGLYFLRMKLLLYNGCLPKRKQDRNRTWNACKKSFFNSFYVNITGSCSYFFERILKSGKNVLCEKSASGAVHCIPTNISTLDLHVEYRTMGFKIISYNFSWNLWKKNCIKIISYNFSSNGR